MINAALRTGVRLPLAAIAISTAIGCASTHSRQTVLDDTLPLNAQSTLAPDEHQRINDELARAGGLERAGELDEAIAVLQGLTQQSFEPGIIHHRLAVLFSKAGDFEQAEVHYREAVRELGPNSRLFTDYGYFLTLQARYGEAEQVLQRAIDLDPHSQRARNNLGIVLASVGQSDAATEVFTHAGANRGEAESNVAISVSWHERLAAVAPARQATFAQEPITPPSANDTTPRPLRDASLELSATPASAISNANPRIASERFSSRR